MHLVRREIEREEARDRESGVFAVVGGVIIFRAANYPDRRANRPHPNPRDHKEPGAPSTEIGHGAARASDSRRPLATSALNFVGIGIFR